MQKCLPAAITCAADLVKKAMEECEMPQGFRASASRKQEARASQASSGDDGRRAAHKGQLDRRKRSERRADARSANSVSLHYITGERLDKAMLATQLFPPSNFE